MTKLRKMTSRAVAASAIVVGVLAGPLASHASATIYIGEDNGKFWEMQIFDGIDQLIWAG